MRIPIVLEEVATELQVVNDQCHAYLNTRTAETTILIADDILLAEGPVDEDDRQDWQREMLPTVREVLASGDWLELPSSSEIHDYGIMQRFCFSVEKEQDREQLLESIGGKGAFRFFRSTVQRLGLTQDWYEYRDRAYEEIAAAWLDARQIPFVRKSETQR